jgi:hypothetical protein
VVQGSRGLCCCVPGVSCSRGLCSRGWFCSREVLFPGGLWGCGVVGLWGSWSGEMGSGAVVFQGSRGIVFQEGCGVVFQGG